MGSPKDNLYMLEEFGKIIDKREQIWEEYDKSKNSVSELEKFSNRFSTYGAEKLPQPLSGANIPSHEISEAISKIKQEDTNIQALNAEIQQHKTEINASKNSHTIAIVFIILILILIIAYLSQ